MPSSESSTSDMRSTSSTRSTSAGLISRTLYLRDCETPAEMWLTGVSQSQVGYRRPVTERVEVHVGNQERAVKNPCRW
ncbi:uncharacterized protein N7503_000117 [Penicillium pulvis]|uniref:uncharacterized protein n=1 Tax=Penicillium pulvis TaxID=1562058 RepID=UPI002547EA75|nr:uncharacterized protein N7503_000117 [Penicillium pulvis]KAJ5813367.1 hypothetical protein N7503_000117 [Penicillium pulvis]